MENQIVAVEELHEGIGASEAGAEILSTCDDSCGHEHSSDLTSDLKAVEPDSSQEVQRGAEVPAPKPPELTDRQIRDLRRKFFTVRHERLTNCEHRFVPTSQPRLNCENCWWTFFNTHPSLVQLTDKFYQEHGKAALIGMRGKRYVTMFGRFMATVNHMKQEEEALKAINGTQSNESRSNSDGEEGGEDIRTAGSVDEGREAEGSSIGLSVSE